MKFTGKKLILLLLYTPLKKKVNISITGRTRLMKMVFLFKEEILPDFKKDKTFEEINLPELLPWKYGPFSKDLLNDLEFLINQQYINAIISDDSPIPVELEEYKYWFEDVNQYELNEYEEEIFTLSEDKGVKKAKEIWDILTENQKEIITDFKTILTNASLDRILEYVYRKYKKEGYIDKSIIRERYLR